MVTRHLVNQYPYLKILKKTLYTHQSPRKHQKYPYSIPFQFISPLVSHQSSSIYCMYIYMQYVYIYIYVCSMYTYIYPRSDWTRGVGSPILQLQNGVPKVPFLQVGRTQRSPRKVFVTKWQSKLTPSYKMSHRFCSTRIRSHPLARFALYRMVGTGGGYTRTILGSLGSNLQQPGQPESRFIFSVLLRSSVCFGVTLSEWPS